MSWVLLFDGECAMCSRAAKWISRLDRRGCVFFASLQGRWSVNAGLAGHAAAKGGTMVVLRESDGVLFTHSDAVLELARVLGWPWRIACVAEMIPRRWRNGVYQFIADRRARSSGRQAACPLPDAALAARMRD